MSHRLVISKIVKTNCVSLTNYFKTPTNANTNLPLLVCENIRNHSINNFELNFDTITQNRAQANGEQPAAIETENFVDAAVNWSRRRRHTKHLFCAPNKWRQVTNYLRGVRFA